MKEFWKMLLAVICGFIIFGIISMVLMTGMFGAMMAAGGATSTRMVPSRGVLAVDMSEFTISEQETAGGDLLSLVQGQNTAVPVSLYKAVNAVRTAAADPGVQYIFLKTDGNTSSIASLVEFRKALSEFRKSGKAVIAYTEQVSTGSYYLASVADKVYTTEYQGATTGLFGLSAQSFYLKDLLDRFGVNMQLIRHGKYKSAGEMYIRNTPSEENKEQYQRMVDSMWESLSAEIADSRGISPDELNAMVDGLQLCLPEDFLEKGMVDGILSREGLKNKLASAAYADSYEDVAFIPFPDYAAGKVVPNLRKRDRIAVIYANGEILDGQDISQVAGDRFASIIDDVRRNDKVKAVVLRVNSPGGSVLASEKIKHELDLLAESKPLVASYGDYAASGGYWISNNCDRIFSDAVTLTGSIGVFGLVPDISKTLKDVARVGSYAAKSHRHADMLSLTRPFDQDEYNYMLRSIEAVYDKFTGIVAEGRGMEKARVDEIGQGRVWTGADALELGLVDEIGGLMDAIAYAADCAGNGNLSDWQVVEYPKPLTTIEMLLAELGQSPEGHRYIESKLKEITRPSVVARIPWQITVF